MRKGRQQAPGDKLQRSTEVSKSNHIIINFIRHKDRISITQGKRKTRTGI